MSDLVAGPKIAAVFNPLPDDLPISERVAYTQSALVAGLRSALTEIAKQARQIADLQRQLDDVATTPKQQAPSLPPTPATILMPSPKSVSSVFRSDHSEHSATPTQVVSSVAATATTATAADLHPPLVQLDVRPVAASRGQGGMKPSSPSTAVAMCQTPLSWLASPAKPLRRQQRRQQDVQRPVVVTPPIARLFSSPQPRWPASCARQARVPAGSPPVPQARFRASVPASTVASSGSDYESAHEHADPPRDCSTATDSVDHKRVLEQTRARRVAAAQSSSRLLVRSYFNMWRACMRRSRSAVNDDTASSTSSAQSRRSRRHRKSRGHRTQQHHAAVRPATCFSTSIAPE
jgi:hypothetical protein